VLVQSNEVVKHNHTSAADGCSTKNKLLIRFGTSPTGTVAIP